MPRGPARAGIRLVPLFSQYYISYILSSTSTGGLFCAIDMLITVSAYRIPFLENKAGLSDALTDKACTECVGHFFPLEVESAN